MKYVASDGFMYSQEQVDQMRANLEHIRRTGKMPNQKGMPEETIRVHAKLLEQELSGMRPASGEDARAFSARMNHLFGGGA